MEKEKSTFDKVIDDAQQYFNAKQELATLKVAEKTSKAISGIVSGLLLSGLLLIAILFASVALGFALTNYFGNASFGFLGVAALYLLILLIIFINREKWIKMPVINTVIKNFFKDNDNGKN